MTLDGHKETPTVRLRKKFRFSGFFTVLSSTLICTLSSNIFIRIFFKILVTKSGEICTKYCYSFIPETVVGKLVVAGEGDEGAVTGAEGEKDLNGRIFPHLESRNPRFL